MNTITFVDENRRFVTTSDDKTIRAWDFDIPVVIKYIAEPHMHSMPAVTLHPSSKFSPLGRFARAHALRPTDRYFAAQSLDNQILVYSTWEHGFRHQLTYLKAEKQLNADGSMQSKQMVAIRLV